MAFLTSSSWTRVTFCSFPSPGAVSLEMAGISTRLGFHSQAQKKAIHLFKICDISVANFSDGSGNSDTNLGSATPCSGGFLVSLPIADIRLYWGEIGGIWIL